MAKNTKESTENFKNKSVDDLYQLLEDLTKEQVNLKLQKSMGQLSSPHMLRIVRRNIARTKTQLHSLNLLKGN